MSRIRKPEAIVCSECGRQATMANQPGIPLANRVMSCPLHPAATLYLRREDLIQQEKGITR